MEPNQPDITDLAWSAKQMAGALSALLGASPTVNDQKSFEKLVEKYMTEGPGKPGIHLYALEYRDKTVVMTKGTVGDYAALHLQGRVEVENVVVPPKPSGPGCWDRPLLRRLENLILTRAADSTLELKSISWIGRKRIWLSRWINHNLARIYLRFPSLPLMLIDLFRDRNSRWGSGWADRLERHVAQTLRGRIESVPRVERVLGDPTARQAVGPHTDVVIGSDPIFSASSEPQPLRFLGVMGALYNRPRSVTLVAQDDNGTHCRLLLIKRKALQDLFIKTPKGQDYLAQIRREFVKIGLAGLLAENRLFCDRVLDPDVIDWTAVTRFLSSPDTSGEPLRQALLSRLSNPPTDTPSDAAKAHFLTSLNKVLATRGITSLDLDPSIFPESNQEEARLLLTRPAAAATPCEVFRLNRLHLASVCKGISPGPRQYPLLPEEFEAFARELDARHPMQSESGLDPIVREKEKDEVKNIIFRAGDISDALYLTLSGMVRVVRSLPGGETVVNNIEGDGYFGETAILDGPEPGESPRRQAGVRALCKTTLIKIPRETLLSLRADDRYSWFVRHLQREIERTKTLNRWFDTGWLRPPTDPPHEVADRLVLTRNLLLIDMERCTRCDACVRGCAASHEGQPRFHRANPELRFGKWEVAGACLHCMDAPCLEACPVGAITFLEDRAVQIHRNRCIGCGLCEKACPFHVIDMYKPLTPEDAPSLAGNKEFIANKCDLCLTDSLDPPCVACCPYDAARRVNPAEAFPGLRGRAVHLDEEAGLKPAR